MAEFNHSTSVSRRQALAGAVGASLVGTVAMSGVRPDPLSDLIDRYYAFLAIPDDGSNLKWPKEIGQIDKSVGSTKPKTRHGAIKSLRWLLDEAQQFELNEHHFMALQNAIDVLAA